jgi:hypothetical protein
LAPTEALSGELARQAATFVERVKAHMDVAYHGVLAEQVEYIVSQARTLDSEQSAALFAYLSAHQCAVEMRETWDKVLGSGVSGVGFKIGLHKGRRAPDDKLYLQNPDLQENLPRGIVFTRDGATGRVDLVLFSNRKFYGRAHGDDDDTDICSHALRDGRFKHFIVSDKANGESAQLSLLRDGVTFVIGSKNRKIAVRTRADVDQYKDQCYSFAQEMAECFFDDYYARMSAATQAEFRQFLTTTRLTLNFEFESQLHQHLVPLFARRLVLIGLTGVHLVGGRSAHPCLGAAVARWFGFPSVILETTLYAKEQLGAVCDRIARQWELEGSVLVLLDEQMRVVDLVKVKTWWYIVLRATREKLRQLRGRASLARQCRLIRERLDTLQRSMGIDRGVIARFKELTCAFAAWMIADQPLQLRETDKDFVKRARTADRADGQKRTRLELFHQDQYPLLWRAFLADSKLPHTDALLTADSSALPVVQIDEVKLPLLVVMQGVPGLGKSALAVEAVRRLAEAGVTAAQAAQDDFVHLGRKKSGAACLAHITDLLEAGSTAVVLLARNNANKMQYQQYQLLNQEGVCRMAFLAPEELQGLGAVSSADAITPEMYKLMYMCVASVLHRKASGADKHPTDELTRGKLANLPFAFLKMYEPHPAAITVRFVADTAPMPPPAFCARVRAILGLALPGEAVDFDIDGDDNDDDDDGAVSARTVDNKNNVDDDDDDDDGNKNDKRKKNKQQQQQQQQKKKQGGAAANKNAAAASSSTSSSSTKASNDDALMQSWNLATPEQIAAVMQQAHRPLAQLAADVQAAITARVADDELPAIGSYIAAKLTMESSTALTDGVGPFPNSWNQLGDHVTLVHSNQYGLHKDKWNELLKLTGVDVRVKPIALLRNGTPGAAANAELPVLAALSASVLVGDRNIDNLVASGEPHITIATGPGVKAHQSGPAVTKARQLGALQPVPAAVGEYLEASLELIVPE